jgi:hypothetical protein
VIGVLVGWRCADCESEELDEPGAGDVPLPDWGAWGAVCDGDVVEGVVVDGVVGVVRCTGNVADGVI